jgi:glycosyltransferase involved in cell wall biosynthesis
MPGGIHDAQLRVLDGVDRILLLTQKEGDDIIKDFGPIRPKKPVYLRNGSDAMPRSPADPSTRDLDICVVGRIEARKNQIAILEAVNQLGLSAVFVGRENPYHKAYCNEFKRRIANSCSAYISGLPHEEILHLMERAKVHVSASWFEVASLVDIEAYLAGCRIVASECGGTRELCGIDAHYVDPSSARSIEMAIRAAYEAATDGLLREGRRQSRAVESWQEVAASLSEIYQAVLSEHDVQTADSRIEAEPVARA